MSNLHVIRQDGMVKVEMLVTLDDAVAIHEALVAYGLSKSYLGPGRGLGDKVVVQMRSHWRPAVQVTYHAQGSTGPDTLASIKISTDDAGMLGCHPGSALVLTADGERVLAMGRSPRYPKGAPVVALTRNVYVITPGRYTNWHYRSWSAGFFADQKAPWHAHQLSA